MEEHSFLNGIKLTPKYLFKPYKSPRFRQIYLIETASVVFMRITIQQEGNTRQSLHRTNQKLNESLTATLRFSLINLDNKTREKMQINDIHTKWPYKPTQI